VDRQTKINQINKRGRVSHISNLEVSPTVIHPDYKSEPCDGILSETGKLEILKLVPKSGDGPYFIARWDQRTERVDIDMHGASRSAIRKFKNEREGYSGHHTRRTADPDKRVFDIQVQMPPLGTIFDGTVSFSNHYKMSVEVGSYSMVTVEPRLIRGGSKTEGA
jgi:hypothetical protein